MKKLIPLALLALLFVGCKTTQQTHRPLEYKVIEIHEMVRTRVQTDKDGNKKEIRYSANERASETAEKLSVEGWTLIELERSSELRNSAEGLRSHGDTMTLVFTRPKTN